MTRLPWIIAILPLSMMAISTSSLGGDAGHSKATLKNPDLHEGMKVKWVYEGCAAYPVEIDEVAEDGTGSPMAAKPKANLATPSSQKKL